MKQTTVFAHCQHCEHDAVFGGIPFQHVAACPWPYCTIGTQAEVSK